MQEIWKDIPCSDGFYQVSNLGRIKSLKYGKPRILSSVCCKGYMYISLHIKGKRVRYSLHRLVAQAFVPNPLGYGEVNHKDENPLNNCADNLEWCSHKYNMHYGTARLRQSLTIGKPVEQLTSDNIPIATYRSAAVAETLLGIKATGIKYCCKGQRKSAGGYIWRYVTESSNT